MLLSTFKNIGSSSNGVLKYFFLLTFKYVNYTLNEMGEIFFFFADHISLRRKAYSKVVVTLLWLVTTPLKNPINYQFQEVLS